MTSDGLAAGEKQSEGKKLTSSQRARRWASWYCFSMELPGTQTIKTDSIYRTRGVNKARGWISTQCEMRLLPTFLVPKWVGKVTQMRCPTQTPALLQTFNGAFKMFDCPIWEALFKIAFHFGFNLWAVIYLQTHWYVSQWVFQMLTNAMLSILHDGLN